MENFNLKQAYDQGKDDPLRFLCFGLGAIGTYVGGSLAAAGYAVSFIERPESLDRLRKSGLRIGTPFGLKTVPAVNIFTSLEKALNDSHYDVALLAVKSFDTESVIESILPFADRFPAILCLQNGVENETKLDSLLGPGRVIGASIATAVGKKGPGDVFVEKMRGIGIESMNPLSDRLIESFNKADLKAEGYPNRADLKWSKMLTNLLGNATSAILDWTPTQIFSDKRIYKVEVRQIQETLAVMKAMGIKLVNLPGTPVKPLIWIIQHFPLCLSQPASSLALGKGRGNKMPSFHIDLHSGQTTSEVTHLNGAVVRAARQLGMDAPVNQTLTKILEDLASGKLAKQEFTNNPEKLISIIEDSE